MRDSGFFCVHISGRRFFEIPEQTSKEHQEQSMYRLVLRSHATRGEVTTKHSGAFRFGPHVLDP